MCIALKISINKIRTPHSPPNTYHYIDHDREVIGVLPNTLVANVQQNIYQVMTMVPNTDQDYMNGRWILSMNPYQICSESTANTPRRHIIVGQFFYRLTSRLVKAKKPVKVKTYQKFIALSYMEQLRFAVKWDEMQCIRLDCQACQTTQLCLRYENRTTLEKSAIHIIKLSRS